MADHALKIHEQPFNDLLSGAKTCEVRNNDRGFQVGDTVQLHEIADTFTGRVMVRKITHVQTGYGLPDGLCVLSYAQLPRQGGEAVAWLTSDKRHLVFSGALDQSQYVEQGMTPLYTHPADQVAEGVVVLPTLKKLFGAETRKRREMASADYRIQAAADYEAALDELRLLLAKSEGVKL